MYIATFSSLISSYKYKKKIFIIVYLDFLDYLIAFFFKPGKALSV